MEGSEKGPYQQENTGNFKYLVLKPLRRIFLKFFNSNFILGSYFDEQEEGKN